jgi:hypothetical protein
MYRRVAQSHFHYRRVAQSHFHYHRKSIQRVRHVPSFSNARHGEECPGATSISTLVASNMRSRTVAAAPMFACLSASSWARLKLHTATKWPSTRAVSLRHFRADVRTVCAVDVRHTWCAKALHRRTCVGMRVLTVISPCECNDTTSAAAHTIVL